MGVFGWRFNQPFRNTAEILKSVFQNTNEVVGGLSPNDFAVSLAGVTHRHLKAVVDKADWYDPEIHPKLQSFAAHYGAAFAPTKPRTPHHKGKIASAVKYSKNNTLKGLLFSSLVDQNDHLLDWEQSVADTRIHGTTKRQVGRHFEAPNFMTWSEIPFDVFGILVDESGSFSRNR